MSPGYVDLTNIWSREKLAMDLQQEWEDPSRLRGVGVEPTRTCVLYPCSPHLHSQVHLACQEACRMVLVKDVDRLSPTRETPKSRHIRSM